MPKPQTSITTFIIFFCLLVPAARADNFSLLYANIRQDRSTKNGVWVSRPLATDEFIFGFLRRNNIQDIEGYCRWLTKNLNYQPDKNDTWLNPQETIDREGGDCEDFALLNRAILHILGYPSQILALCSPKGNHAICAFQIDGYYAWFDNQKLIKTKTQSFSEFTQYILRHTAATRIAQLNPQDKFWQLIARRS